MPQDPVEILWDLLFTVREVRVTSGLYSPFCDTIPWTGEPAEITVTPSTTTGSATVAEKLPPALAVFKPMSSPKRTIRAVFAGTTVGCATSPIPPLGDG